MARNTFTADGTAPDTLLDPGSAGVYDLAVINEGEGSMNFTVNFDASWTDAQIPGHGHRPFTPITSGDEFWLGPNETLYFSASRGAAAGNIGAENVRKTRVSPASVVGDYVVVLASER